MILSLDSVCVLLVATLIAQVLIHVWTYCRYYYLGYLIPGPQGSFAEKALHLLYFFGSMEKVTNSIITVYENTREILIFKIWMGLDLVVVIVDPDTINRIFREHLQKADFYKFLDPWSGGKSILDRKDIPGWRRRRHMIASKSFSFGSLEYYNEIFHEESKILTEKIESLAKSGTSFEPFHLTEKAGFATVLRTMCGLNLNIQQNVVHDHVFTKASETEFKVYDEIINVLGEDPNITPTRSQINELHLLTRVIKETLRLFPPAPFAARVANCDIQAGEYTIPKGSTMAVLIYGIHRDPHHWPDPTRFDPDRFLPSEVAKRNPNAFMPFSLGPRNCIAYKYAMLSIKITISTILRRYRILPGDKCKCLEDIRFEFGLTLVPLQGNDIRIEKRYL